LAQQQDLYNSSIEKAKTLKGRRKTEQRRLTRNSDQSKVLKFHPEVVSKGKKKEETAKSAIASSSEKKVELYKQEQSEMPVKPALFVVPDWDEFMEDW
jgi:hypothetical protein